MSAEAPPAAEPSTVSPPERRGKPRRRSRWRWTGVTAACLLGLTAAGALAGALWVKRYLRGDAFREELNGAARRVLSAEAEMGDLAWRDTTVYAAEFRAEGTEEALFRKLAVTDLRASLNPGALWDRVWRVENVEIARVEADFSPSPRLPALSPEPAVAEPRTAGWLQRLLPNRAEIGPARVNRFDFLWRDGLDRAEGREFALTVKPSLEQGFATVSGSGGRVRFSGFGKELRVSRLEATLRSQEARVEDFAAEMQGARLTAEGTVTLKPQPALRLNAGISGVELDNWITGDWLHRISGSLRANARVTGDPREPSRLQAQGEVSLQNGALEGLPVLGIIARKTRNESFLRLLLREARGDFTRLPDGAVRLENIRVDAPGLLRLKGGVVTGANESLNGGLLLGIVPGTLRYLAGAEQRVFQPPERAELTAAERALLSEEDGGLLWARLALSGTLSAPREDLSERLARAWFNATVEEVLKMSVEEATRAAATVTDAAASAAGEALDSAKRAAPDVLEAAPKVLGEGVNEGLKLLEALKPAR